MKRWFMLVTAAVLMSLSFGGVVAQDDTAETTVAVAETGDLGQFLTDAAGMTLYLFTNDTEANVSVCEGDCATAWPPFTAEEPLTLPDGVDGELTLFERPDGSMQVAYNGIPLYYWQADQNPGDTTGHEVGGVWFVAFPGAQMGEAMVPMASPEASPEASPMAMGAPLWLVRQMSLANSSQTPRV